MTGSGTLVVSRQEPERTCLETPLNLAIVVPVLNEADNVLPLVREVEAALSFFKQPYELVFVDDGSSDQTWEAIHEAQHQYPWVRGLRHAQCQGQSAALWTGFQATHTPLLATLDGDLQDDPADFCNLFAGLDEADFLCGVRGCRQDPWLRRMTSRVARRARKMVLGVDFCDTGCGLRAFRRAALTGVFGFKGFHRFLPILVFWQGAVVKEVPVNHRPRKAGFSKYGVWNRLGCGIADLLAMAWYNKRRLNRPPDAIADPADNSDCARVARLPRLG
jgi:dolichol-phosphate mannosyltransferase